MMSTYTIASTFDNLILSIAVSEPLSQPKGIVVLVHGMSEHKKRYFPFMEYLSENGYICVIYDQRGHGKSIKQTKDLGYFYSENTVALVHDLGDIVEFSKVRFPGLPVVMFAHSMGTLVARNFIKQGDKKLKGLVLCGPPSKNSASGVAALLAHGLCKVPGGHHISNVLYNISVGRFERRGEMKNSWLSTDKKSVVAYNCDPLCGHKFSNNGYYHLFSLLSMAYDTRGWKVNNKDMPIWLIAGADDPVIESEKKFTQTVSFLQERGYTHVNSLLYRGMRHELLNETYHTQVYQDVKDFFDTCLG